MGIDSGLTRHNLPRRAVFLDRDGVINRNIVNPQTGQYESPLTPEDFHFTGDALPAIRRLQSSGYLLFLVSNQPNYALGKASLETLAAIHVRMKVAFDKEGIVFAEFFYCHHHPRGIVHAYSGPCVCRKPSPFFLLQAQRDYILDLARSWMIGDRATDTQCGRSAGVRTIRILAEKSTVSVADPNADHIAADLPAAVAHILKTQSA